MYSFYSLHRTCGKGMLFIILLFNYVRTQCDYLFNFMYGTRTRKVWLFLFKTSERVTFALWIFLFFEETCIDSFCLRGGDKRAVTAFCHCSCSVQTKGQASASSQVKLIINVYAVIWPKSHKQPDVLLVSPLCALTTKPKKLRWTFDLFFISLSLLHAWEVFALCFNAVRMKFGFLYKEVIGL